MRSVSKVVLGNFGAGDPFEIATEVLSETEKNGFWQVNVDPMLEQQHLAGSVSANVFCHCRGTPESLGSRVRPLGRVGDRSIVGAHSD